MPFKLQEKRVLLDNEGRPVIGLNGVEYENIGEPREHVWVQNKATREVIPQTTKAALALFTGPDYRILKDDAGRKLYEQQQGEARLSARQTGNIGDLEVDLPEDETEGDDDGESDDDGDGDANSGNGSGSSTPPGPKANGRTAKKPAPTQSEG